MATVLRTVLLVTVLAAPVAGMSPSSGQTEDAPGDLSVEALLARGIVHSRGSEMRAGLAELRSAALLDPGRALARQTLAIALLRAGRFDEAEAEFAAALGEERMLALSSGRLSSADLPDSTDKSGLLDAMEGHVLVSGDLLGLYARP